MTPPAFKAWEMRKINYRTSGIQYVGGAGIGHAGASACENAHKFERKLCDAEKGGKISIKTLYKGALQIRAVCIFHTHRLCEG